MARSVPLADRIASASKDPRCVTRGVQWVRQHYGLTNPQAHTVIAESRKAHAKDVSKMDATADLSRILSQLANAERKWPGVLTALITDPYRAVAQRYNVSPGSIWFVCSRIKNAEVYLGTPQNVVRAALR